MDINRDEVRRQLRDADREQQDSLPAYEEAMERIFVHDEDHLPPAAKAEIAIGGSARRRVLAMGGVAAGAAVLAACKPKHTLNVSRSGANITTTSIAGFVYDNITLLRTASSIEVLAVAAYQAALDSGVVKDPAIGDAAKLFQSHHREHAALFQNLTQQLGGTPYDQPNPTLFSTTVKPVADGLTQGKKTQADVIDLAYALETTAAATYQQFTDYFTTAALRAAIMSVGGVEARHAAVMASVTEGSQVVPITATASVTTTSAKANVTTTSVPGKSQVYEVAGAFFSVVTALGPASYVPQT